MKNIRWEHFRGIFTEPQRGSEVIKARGSSSAGSAANAIVDSIIRLTTNTAADDTFSVSSVSKGDYQIDPDLIFSFPSRVVNNSFGIIQGLPINSFSQEKINCVLNELRQERDIVKSLKLI